MAGDGCGQLTRFLLRKRKFLTTQRRARRPARGFDLGCNLFLVLFLWLSCCVVGPLQEETEGKSKKS
jgi:hypothetical protein